MIDRQGGVIVFCCDVCGEERRGDSNEFSEEWEAAKKAGWRTRKIANEWLHSCEGCKL